MASPLAHARIVRRFDHTTIRRFELFKAMSDEELENIVGLAQEHTISRGQPIFRQGDLARHFYFLLRGRLKVVQITRDGQQVVVRIVNPGEFFGVAKALRRTDYPATAVAAVESVALAWNSVLWDDMTARHSALAMNALYTIANHLQEMHARMREFSTDSVERRIAHALVRLITQAGRQTRDGTLINFPITRQDIAEMTGTTISTVSRTLSSWADRGIIKGGRLRIVVRKPHELLRLTRE